MRARCAMRIHQQKAGSYKQNKTQRLFITKQIEMNAPYRTKLNVSNVMSFVMIVSFGKITKDTNRDRCI